MIRDDKVSVVKVIFGIGVVEKDHVMFVDFEIGERVVNGGVDIVDGEVFHDIILLLTLSDGLCTR